jgi:hypothetical protein
MEELSREWDVNKELEGGSYYLHKETPKKKDQI